VGTEGKKREIGALHISLVDYDAPYVESLSKPLSERGLEILSGFRGEEAPKTLALGEDISVVVLDLEMAYMDGL
jgi:DNA-binding response OmpR family regulator